jgi:hypothetical protein
MSLIKSKCWYSYNCLHFLKCAVAVPLSRRFYNVPNFHPSLIFEELVLRFMGIAPNILLTDLPTNIGLGRKYSILTTN